MVSLSPPPQGWTRSKPFYAFVIFGILFFFFGLVTVNPSAVPVPSVTAFGTHSRDFLKQHIGHVDQSSNPTDPAENQHVAEQEPEATSQSGTGAQSTPQTSQSRPANDPPKAVSIPGLKAKYAFATWLAGADHEIPEHEDHYFIATRLLVWQLLHAKDTRSRKDIPVIVAVTDRVPERQRERLRKDGATVIQMPDISASWLKAGWDGWNFVMAKLRLFELIDFERIAFLDADTVLSEPLDGLFDDPAVAVEQTTLLSAPRRFPGAIKEPSTYVFAGNQEGMHGHQFPPTESGRDFPNENYLNAGFFVIKPDVEMLKYYFSILNIENSFDSSLPEQALLNEAHSREGPMPWKQVSTLFNIHYPVMEDVNKGVKSVHEKWWSSEGGALRFWMRARRWRMEGYYEAMDALEKVKGGMRLRR